MVVYNVPIMAGRTDANGACTRVPFNQRFIRLNSQSCQKLKKLRSREEKSYINVGQLLGRVGGTLAGMIPGVGGLVQPAIGAGAVKAFGEATIAYFENLYPNKIYVKK